MTTENLRRRIPDGPNGGNTVEDDDEYDNEDYYDSDDDNGKERSIEHRLRAAITRRGWLSLVIAVGGPASLHLIDIFYFRSAERTYAKPNWYATPWMMDAVMLLSSLMISLSSWFTWAESENGFLRKPTTVAFLYLGYFGLSVAWDPITFGLGAIEIGILVTLMRVVFVFAIGYMLHDLNCDVGHLVMDAGGVLCLFVFRCTPWENVLFKK